MAEEALKFAVVFITGLSIGSFINCLVWRQNNNMKMTMRSQCGSCGRRLSWWENIPLLSFIILGGRCRSCKKKIPSFYLLVELLTGVLFLYAYWMSISHFSGSWLHLVRDLFMLSILLIIVVSDVLYQVIWPETVWIGAVGGFIFNLLGGFSVASMGWGLLFGGGFFLLQYLLSKGKWIGGGDVRLGVMIGIWLGWPVTLLAMASAYLFGAIVGITLLIAGKRTWSSQIPFGPFLALATLWAMNYGQAVLNWFAYWLR